MKLKKIKKTIAVKINSKAEFKLLMELAEKAGFKWYSGDLPTHFVGEYNPSEVTLFVNKEIAKSDVHINPDAVPLKKVIKFEIGDKVRIREDIDEIYKTDTTLLIKEMCRLAGKEATITEKRILSSFGFSGYLIDGWVWRKKWLEPVLEDVEEKSEFYNGNVVCVEAYGMGCFTKGKIYTFKDGFSTFDNGDVTPTGNHPIKDFSDFEKRYCSKFIEVVE